MTPATEYMLNTSLTLVGIMGVAWLLVYASRRWQRAAPRGPLELLDTLRLEGKRAVYLIRVGERVVALGASEGGMIKVMELGSSDLVDAPRPVDGFGALLARLKLQSRANPAFADSVASDAGDSGSGGTPGADPARPAT